MDWKNPHLDDSLPDSPPKTPKSPQNERHQKVTSPTFQADENQESSAPAPLLKVPSIIEPNGTIHEMNQVQKNDEKIKIEERTSSTILREMVATNDVHLGKFLNSTPPSTNNSTVSQTTAIQKELVLDNENIRNALLKYVMSHPQPIIIFQALNSTAISNVTFPFFLNLEDI